MSTNNNADLPEYYVIVCFVEGDFKVILRLLSHFGIIFDVGLQPRFLLKTYDSMYFFSRRVLFECRIVNSYNALHIFLLC